MPTLNDYLGGLVASVTEARVMADAHTVQVAEQYAQHELLRHFPVPRMRIGDIVLTIPVAIEGLSERKEYQLAPNGNAEFQKAMTREIPQYIDYRELPAVAAQKFQSALANRIPTLVNGIRDTGERGKPMLAFADGIIADLFVIGIETKLRDGKFPEGYSQDEIAKQTFELGMQLVSGVVEKPVLDQLTVIADAARLREQRPEDIVRIQLKILEDGVEWQTTTRDDGTIDRRLIPE